MKKCDRCKINKVEIETIEGLFLCSGCESIRLNCINEPLEEKNLKEFIKELN